MGNPKMIGRCDIKEQGTECQWVVEVVQREVLKVDEGRDESLVVVKASWWKANGWDSVAAQWSPLHLASLIEGADICLKLCTCLLWDGVASLATSRRRQRASRWWWWQSTARWWWFDKGWVAGRLEAEGLGELEVWVRARLHGRREGWRRCWWASLLKVSQAAGLRAVETLDGLLVAGKAEVVEAVHCRWLWCCCCLAVLMKWPARLEGMFLLYVWRRVYQGRTLMVYEFGKWII